MASQDDFRFRPKLGNIRSRGGGKTKCYINQVLQSAGLSGSWSSFSAGRGASRFTGARIGRGAGQGTVAASRRQAIGRRRVVIKTRIVKTRGKQSGAARAHLRYIQRDAVGHDGERGQLYDSASDEADGKAFTERGSGDRHQFRFIVSPEDAAEMEGLKPFVRDLMAQMERDLGTELDWVAVDHFNTDNPHSHIVLRGKDERSKDLIIARDYISHGMRERASELLTLELGPRSERQIRDGLRHEVERDALTHLDRELVRQAEAGLLDLRAEARGEYRRFKRSLHLGRAQRLTRMGLAIETGPKQWRLSSNLEQTLRSLGARGDIIKTMHRELKAVGLQQPAGDYAIFDPSEKGARIVGRVVARGLSDELHDRHYLIVDSLDGRTHYAEVGQLKTAGDFGPGAIVALGTGVVASRAADRTIAEISGGNEGLYSSDLHRLHDPRASDEFIRTHVRRLEALRRADVVERFPDGRWGIPKDYPDKARTFDEARSARQPAKLALLSAFVLEAQVTADGATWLDHQLAGRHAEPLHEAGFGRDVQEALERRRQWLIQQGWAEEEEERIFYRSGMLNTLRQREIRRVAGQLARELGMPFREVGDGERIEGIYRRPIHMASGKFALVQKSHEFTLVPWRAVLERNRGKAVAGIIRGDRISWSLTRKRSLGVS